MGEQASFNERNIYHERADQLEQVLASDILNSREKEIFVMDDAEAAVFLGIKPVYIPDSMTWDRKAELRPYMRIAEYCAQDTSYSFSNYVNTNLHVLSDIGVIHWEALHRTITRYHDVFNMNEADAKNIERVAMEDLVRHVLTTHDIEMQYGTILGYPPGYSLNYPSLSDVNNKIRDYFKRGKPAALNDGWTDEEAVILDALYLHPDGIQFDQAYAMLNKHRHHLDLIEDEILSYISAKGFQALGYTFFAIPLPENQFTHRDNILLKEMQEADAQLTKVKELIQFYRERETILNS